MLSTEVMANFSQLNGYKASYSDRYRNLQQNHIEQLREEILGQKEDVLSKNRKLSAETNKRRKEILDKKKAREDEEERRRNDILAERKARIQEVTQKYQRASTAKLHSHHHGTRSHSRRAVSASTNRASRKQINLEEALKNIRGVNSLQYNSRESGSQFLQANTRSNRATDTDKLLMEQIIVMSLDESWKYGAYQTLNSSDPRSDRQDAFALHKQSVKDLDNPSRSHFEQQLMQHQTLISKNLGSHAACTDVDDARSVDSQDSLESEQPSFRSHVIQPSQQMEVNKLDSSMNVRIGANIDLRGGDTYRQESPIVLFNNDSENIGHTNNGKLPPDLSDTSQRQQKPPRNNVSSNNASANNASANNAPSSGTAREVFQGFQVVENQLQDAVISKDLDFSGESKSSKDENSFYLKSRIEAQPKIESFPPYAWGARPDEDSTESTPTKEATRFRAKKVELNYQDERLANTSNSSMNEYSSLNDTISDTASDSGRPRSILKKHNDTANLPRSHSSPSIRDSLEVAKSHMKGASKPETPKSAKKSVRFNEKCQPVFFHKGSSPSNISSGIPRPVPPKPKTQESGAPHINDSLIPSTKSSTKSKTVSPSSKGPVVAKHGLPLTSSSGKNTVNEKDESDIRLDKTPTDDEIEVLWDKVRSCLLDSPSTSARSAPPDLQHPPEKLAATPIKQPIVKKITASNINHIGNRNQNQNNFYGSNQLLNRQKQKQQSFASLHTVEIGHKNDGTPYLNGGENLSSQQQEPQYPPQSDRLGISDYPTKSLAEPNLSVGINSNAQNVSESLMSYLTAEQLAEHDNLNENDIMKAMADNSYRRRLGSNGRPVAPLSALSMEEQKILQSLERLDDKLKLTSEGSQSSRYQVDMSPSHSNLLCNTSNGLVMPGTSTPNNKNGIVYPPHPPYSQSHRQFTTTSRGFKGHKPFQSQQRRGSADSARSGGSVVPHRQVRLY